MFIHIFDNDDDYHRSGVINIVVVPNRSARHRARTPESIAYRAKHKIKRDREAQAGVILKLAQENSEDPFVFSTKEKFINNFMNLIDYGLIEAIEITNVLHDVYRIRFESQSPLYRVVGYYDCPWFSGPYFKAIYVSRHDPILTELVKFHGAAYDI